MRHTNELNSAQRAVAERFLARKGTGIMAALMGPTNRGKTQLALAISKNYKTFTYELAHGFYLGIRDAIKIGKSLPFIRGLAGKSLLIIDEAQDKGEHSWDDRNLRFLFDEAYRNRVDTIVIANAPAAEFEKLFGDSIARRFEESGGVIDCSTWPVIPKSEKNIVPEIVKTNDKKNDDHYTHLLTHEHKHEELTPEAARLLAPMLNGLSRAYRSKLNPEFVSKIENTPKELK